MRRALLALCLLAVCWPLATRAEPIDITTQVRSLNAEQPELDRVGSLLFRGALDMTSIDERFGGLSGLEVSADGSILTMVSDRGTWIVAQPQYDERGWLSGLAAADIAPMLDPQGAPLAKKNVQDAEAVSALPDGGLLVAFEHRHRLWRYDDGPVESRRPEPWSSPPGLDRLPYNEGLEAMTALPGGRLLAMAQDAGADGDYPAFLWDGAAWQSLNYRRAGGFQPSGAAALPNGDLLVLERRFSWIGGLGSRLMRVRADDIRPGALLQGTEIAALKPPLINDNWEGVATATGPRGETLIYLISDDNFLALLSNYLIMFELIE